LDFSNGKSVTFERWLNSPSRFVGGRPIVVEGVPSDTVLFLRRGLVRVRDGMFAVGDESFPPVRVLGVVLAGTASMTGPAWSLAGEKGIPVARVRRGRVVSVSVPFTGSVGVRLAQYEAVRGGSGLRLAVAFVGSCVRARAAFLRFLGLEDAAVEVEGVLDGLEGVGSVGELRGLEGRAARVYFGALAEVLPGWAFSGRRTRRPPRSPFDSALGLGYQLFLLPVLTGRAVAAGLDPFLGVLHVPREGRPSFVLDLMEEWRVLAVDVPVVRWFSDGVLDRSSFVRRGEGVFVRDARGVLRSLAGAVGALGAGVLRAVDRRLGEVRGALSGGSSLGVLGFDVGDVERVWEAVGG